MRGMAAKVILGGALIVMLAVGTLVWWAFDRPFGGATCWVNFKADTFEEATLLEASLSSRGLDARLTPLKDGRPPALPVVTVRGGFWKTESSLEDEVLDGLAEVGGGRFDQCRTPSLGD